MAWVRGWPEQDGSQTKNGSNGTGMVAIHDNHRHTEAKWNLGKHVEVHDTELFGILQATSYSKQWAVENTSTNTIWIFVNNQAAIRKFTSPKPIPGQRLAIRILDNLHDILKTRDSIKANIQRVPGRGGHRK